MINKADISNCVSGLVKQQHVKWACTDVLPLFARKMRARPGAVAVAVLRAYQPWHCDPDANRPAGSETLGVIRGPDRGLAEVHKFMQQGQRVSGYSPTMKPLEQKFRDGEAKSEKLAAAQMLADAEIVLVEWVSMWNHKGGFKDFLSVSQFVEKYGVPERTVRDWCEKGDLKAVMVGNAYKIDVSDLDYDPEPGQDPVDIEALGMSIVSGK